MCVIIGCSLAQGGHECRGHCKAHNQSIRENIGDPGLGVLMTHRDSFLIPHAVEIKELFHHTGVSASHRSSAVFSKMLGDLNCSNWIISNRGAKSTQASMN